MADKSKKADETLLQEIRDNYTRARDFWEEIYEAGRKDIRCVAGDPWEPEERKAREDPGDAAQKRPTVVFDELQQYINQAGNEVRMNKRAIKVTPDGDGSNEEHAELRANRIREIEYKSNAQVAYATAYEDMLSRSFGFVKVTTEYVGDSFKQEIKIKRVANPESVYLDPDAKEADYSDMRYAFVVDYITKAEFKRRFGEKVTITDFDADLMAQAPQWVSDNRVVIAQYWRIESEYRTKYLVARADGTTEALYKDEYIEAEGDEILTKRECETRKVTMCLTNGVETWDKTEWKGQWIPIVPFFGKEMYVDMGGGTKKILLSLVRFAREPYMAYCAIRSIQAEYAAMLPKVTHVMYEGQQNTGTDWKHIHKVPTAYATVLPTLPDLAAGTILPLPQLLQKDAQAIAILDNLAESYKRSIQASMGLMPLPTEAQRPNQKSGIALQKIESQYQKGSFHFLDNFERGVYRLGVIIDDLLPEIESDPMEVGIRKADDTHEVVRINEPMQGKDGQMITHTYGEGNFGVTISTGPSFESQREEAAMFLDTLIANLQAIPAPPPIQAELLSLAIRLKNLGPLGDQMAELLAPNKNGQNIPPQVKAQMDQMAQMVQQLTQQLQMLVQEREAKILELQSKEKIAAINADVELQKIKLEAAIAEAELKSKEGIDMLQQRLDELELTLKTKMAGEDRRAQSEMQGEQIASTERRAAQTAVAE